MQFNSHAHNSLFARFNAKKKKTLLKLVFFTRLLHVFLYVLGVHSTMESRKVRVKWVTAHWLWKLTNINVCNCIRLIKGKWLIKWCWFFVTVLVSKYQDYLHHWLINSYSTSGKYCKIIIFSSAQKSVGQSNNQLKCQHANILNTVYKKESKH